MTSRLKPKQTFHLTRTKRRVLELLAEYFCLRVKDVAQLLRDREPNPNDLRATRHTLGLLFQEKLINRLPYFDLDTEGMSYVYGLSDKAVKSTADLFGIEDYYAHNFSVYKTFDEHSARTLDHELEISYFHMALRRFIFGSDEMFYYWKQSDLKRGIHPDALFKLDTPKGEYAFFLEIEKGKKNFDDLTKKLDRYAKYYDTDDCEKDWGFRKFRVLIVQKNDVRRRNLLDHLSMFGNFKHKMFWLTTETMYKNGIGGEIFLTPKDFNNTAYSFISL